LGVLRLPYEGVAVIRKPAAILFVLSLAVLALALLPAAGLAAKGGNGGGGGKPGGGGSTGGSSSITGPVMVNDTSTPGVSFGDTVTFDVSTTATTQPYVNLLCYQDGVLVANGWNGFFDGALNPTRNFGLYSPSWKSGDAECTAWLDMVTRRGTSHLASTSFHVDA
jgi:hypothetical protein